MPCSSSSIVRTRGWTYDVFVSFRGYDTRYTFVDHLYTALVQRGIHAYIDNKTLPRGKPISPELLKAIEESRCAVVVFSEDYASWCLEELAYIMECHYQIGQKDSACVVCLLLHGLTMNRGFLDSGGRNNKHRKKTTMDTGTCSASGCDVILNDATHCVDAAMKVVSPSVVEETVAMECPVLNTPDVGPNPPLHTQEANSAGNALGNGIDVVVPVDSIHAITVRFSNTSYGVFLRKKVAYLVVANYVRNTLDKYGLVRSMFSSSTGLFFFQFGSMDGLDAMLENGPCEDGLSVIATKLSTPLMLDSYTSDMCMQSWGRSSYARVMIELRADVELKDNIVVAMPKITKEGHYTCNVRVEYEWKPPRCSSCKVFGHIHEECSKNTGAGEKKTVKKPSQTSRGVLVGPKMGFKPHKEYRLVPKKSTVSSNGNKKKGVKPTIEVSNSNPFDVLNSVDTDGEFGTNRGTTNLVNNRATSSRSSFINVDNSSSGTTLIIEKIRMFEDLLTSEQAILVDKAGNPLKNVEFPGDNDSEDEVVSVDNDMTRSIAYESVGQDLSHELQAICDNQDIRVRGVNLSYHEDCSRDLGATQPCSMENNLIGIKARVDNLYSLSGLEATDEVSMLGICAMRGIGKTALFKKIC
nr:hypothetical protein [Tanacetum cinerariifolium]